MTDRPQPNLVVHDLLGDAAYDINLQRKDILKNRLESVDHGHVNIVLDGTYLSAREAKTKAEQMSHLSKSAIRAQIHNPRCIYRCYSLRLYYLFNDIADLYESRVVYIPLL
jgi:hypothetical protein